MNRNVIFLLILIIGLILQVTLFSFFTPWGIKPDLILVLIIVIAILEGPKTGLMFGVIGGLLQDVFLGDFISVNTIIKAPFAYITGYLEGHFYKGNFLLAPFITFIASNTYYLLTIILSEELIFNVNYWQTFKNIMFPSSVYNSILALIVYIVLYQLFNYGDHYGR
ncbi:MAG: rod shape-determining protein MreD [Bacillota bacterium]